MTIEKRIERIEAILDARGLDWDHPRVEENHFAGADKMVAEEPAKKWRILEPGEVVQEGDWVNALCNKPDEDPPGGGWIPARASLIGQEASQAMWLYFARPVTDEPAKEPEPERPAGQKPDPGKGYRVLSKNPPEELQEGDELECEGGTWRASDNARTHKRQARLVWYRRKIEQPKPAEPEYREPVLPADGGMACEFSEEGDFWSSGRLGGVRIGKGWFSTGGVCWRHCRIKKDA